MPEYSRVEFPMLRIVLLRRAKPGMGLEKSAFDRNGRVIGEPGESLTEERIRHQVEEKRRLKKKLSEFDLDLEQRKTVMDAMDGRASELQEVRTPFAAGFPAVCHENV